MDSYIVLVFGAKSSEVRWCNWLNSSLLASIIESFMSVTTTIICWSQRTKLFIIRSSGTLSLPSIVQLCGRIGSYWLLRFDCTLIKSRIIMIRFHGRIVRDLILEHLNFRSSTLLSPLPSFYLFRGTRNIYIVSIKCLFPLFVKKMLEVFVAFVHI